jgi:23S rRNA G2445 N2-methylase RlmL
VIEPELTRCFREQTKFEISADFIRQQHTRRRCFSSMGWPLIAPRKASNLAMKSKCNAMSVERIISISNFLNRPSTSSNNAGHRSSMIRDIVRQCRFSRTERSLKMVASEEPDAARNAFVTPGWAASWPTAAIHNASISIGEM